jgi:hypothetical protein
MRLPAGTLAGLALLEVKAQHTDPKAKGLFGVIGRKLHQGDRVLRHCVKTHTRRVVALDHRRPNPAVRVRSHIRTVDPLALIGMSVRRPLTRRGRDTDWRPSSLAKRRDSHTAEA